MVAATKKEPKSPELIVSPLTEDTAGFFVLGTSPLIMNCMSAKVRQSLLAPARKMTASQKQANQKHDPLAEYQASVYRDPDDDGPTRLLFPAAGFKRAMASAALDIPSNVKRTQVGRLSWVNGQYVHIFGVPQLYMAVVRNADINRTPDIRTRAVLPNWCAEFTMSYASPVLTRRAVGELMGSAGRFIGVGDNRQEKGAGNFGQFTLVQQSDTRFLAAIASGGRAAQDAALADPDFYDNESQELFLWHEEEMGRRYDKPDVAEEEDEIEEEMEPA